MNTRLSILILTALLAVAASGSAMGNAASDSNPNTPNIVSIDQRGELSGDSRKALQRLKRIAKQEGAVPIWITLSYQFDPVRASEDQEFAAIQQADFDRKFDQVLGPMLDARLLLEPTDGRILVGPSFFAFATKKGLKRLTRTSHVAQIVQVTFPGE